MGTPRPSFLDEFEPMGTRDMSSTPQAMATSTTPEPTRLVARLVACCDEPHWVSTVVAAVVSGRPALSQAVRPMLNDCSPTWLTHPVTTWPDLGRVDARAGDELAEHGGQQVGGVHGGQAAVAAADGGADGFDDHDLGHGRST